MTKNTRSNMAPRLPKSMEAQRDDTEPHTLRSSSFNTDRRDKRAKISIRIDPDLRQRLRTWCSEQDITVNDLLVDFIERTVDKGYRGR